MAYNFKSIADVDVINNPSDSTNVLIEEDGFIKRVPKSAVGETAENMISKIGTVEIADTVTSEANVLIEEDGAIKRVAKDKVVPANVVTSPVTAAVGQTIVVKAVDEAGKPTEWEAANMQPRTHWEEEGLVEFLPETTLEFTATGPSGGKWGVINSDFEDGKTYIVKWDNVTYECVAQNTGIGNRTLIDREGGNGEPFWIGSYSGVSIMASEIGTHTVSISVSDTIVHTIDAKYLPAGIGGGETPDMVITVSGHSYNKLLPENCSITEGSMDKVFEAFHEGRYPIVKIRFNLYGNTDYTAIREEYDACVCTYG